MMSCQLCNDTNGPFEFADVYDDGRSKVMLICEDCANIIKKKEKKIRKEIKKNNQKISKKITNQGGIK